MIETLSLRNFKILREVDLRLHPLTLIVGPNASGKTTLLQALTCITECLSIDGTSWTELLKAFGGSSDAFRSFAPNGSLGVECSGRYGDKELHFHLSFERKMNDTLPYQVGGRWGDADFRASFPAEMVQTVRPAPIMNLDVRRLASRSLLKEPSQSLPSNGEGLSTVVADLYLEHPDRFGQLVSRLKEVVPVVQSLRLRRTPDGYELLFDMLGAEGVPASAVSEGTLLALALLTVVTAPNPPQLVLIDDLERGLHPRALGHLIEQFRAIQRQSPELQIVATSHSPYLLDHLKADEILLTSLAEDGYAAVRPLTDHPDYERWKDVMAPGEFWSTVGERWVTEQAPR